MIKAFISKVSEGRTMCAIAECAAQKNKKVVFITTEIPENKIAERFDAFEPKCEKLIIKFFPIAHSIAGFYKLIEKYSEEYDVICIDLAVSPEDLDLQKLNDACFSTFTNQCQELWITVQANRTIDMTNLYLIKKSEIENLLTIKQICRKMNHPRVSGWFIESVDLETKDVKMYNLSKLLKNK
jgi:hypothetical protein